MNGPFLSLNCIFKYGFIEIIEIKNKIVLGLCWFLDGVHQECLGKPQQSVLIDKTLKLSRAPISTKIASLFSGKVVEVTIRPGVPAG